jgi:hypothetical protein
MRMRSWYSTGFAHLAICRPGFGYNHESVKWVEQFIEQQRSPADVAANTIAKLTQILGSYLGECIIHTYSGAWRQRDNQWGVFFDESNAVFPFNKVGKQFQNGLAGGDSILSFFELIGPVILKRPWACVAAKTVQDRTLTGLTGNNSIYQMCDRNHPSISHIPP